MLIRNFKYNKHLCARLWLQNGQIDSLASQALQMLVWEFIRYLGVVGIPLGQSDIRDIYLHGSSTNYYYDKFSDIDVCIVADLSSCLSKLPNGINWFMLYKSLLHSWKRTFRLSIYGRGIDISILDISDTPYVGGRYSLIHNTWTQPTQRLTREELRVLHRESRKRCRVILRQCQYMLRNNMSAEFIDAYLIANQQMRKNSMYNSHDQPLTSMTMGFKMARNHGIFRKLRNRARMSRSKKYRLE